RHKIAPWHILGHSDIAPDRKCDPGELFDWQFLASEAIGFWPDKAMEIPVGASVDIKLFQQGLADYGYGIDITGQADPQTQAVIRAFQRHFRPADVRGIADSECYSILENLLEKRRNY
ncbi:MAG: peptidoglycan-binding protein, partial [Emcibacter sp.]|nr:peptidoglycan-binding protein [Emcibacter sp.]